MMWPVVTATAWPYNHEYAAPFERVEALRRALLAGDLFPTWTPFCFNGHGSPSPLIYHRLYNFTAAWLALPLGTSVGCRVALVLFGWLGAFGLFRAARQLAIGPTLAMLLAAIFVWSPYSLTDWLVRGSFAEFASMMVLPWLLDAAFRQLQGERVWLQWGLSLAAAMHAHQAIGLFVAVLPVVSTAIALVTLRGRRRAVWVDALTGAALAAALVLPWLIAVARVGSLFRLDTLKIYVPWTQFVPWSRYVADDGFAWGQTFQGFSVELSRWVWWALGALLVTSVLSGARVARRLEAFFLVVILTGASALQFEVSRQVYEAVPKAELLQFPWRLLAVATPIAVLLLGVFSQALAGRGAWGWLALLLVGWVTVKHATLVRSATTIGYRVFTLPEFEQKLTELDGPWSAQEYLPRDVSAPPPRTPWVTSQGCRLVSTQPDTPGHFTKLEVVLQPGPACRLVFSQFDTPLLLVEGDGTRVPGQATITVEVPAGGTRVVLRRRALPSLWGTP
jgi:hypothetical protein